MDRLTREQRRKTMQAIKSKDSKIEKMFQRALQEKGHKFETNYGKVEGKPDIVFLSLKIAIFCDSDFWHGYNWEEKKFDIKSNRDFWWKKIERTISRDREVTEKLRKDGWKVLRFWGHEISGRLEDCLDAIEEAIREKSTRDY